MTTGQLLRPGTLRYSDALELQHRTAAAVRAGAPDTLIILQHPHTYTLGARGLTPSLLHAEEAYRARGAEVIRSDRGGDVTYHGPGQIVGYPIVNLRARSLGPGAYVCAIEQVMIDALAAHGVSASRAEGRPGVWCGDAKVGAIGVKISGGVSTHGFALNVSTDLGWFDAIVPCGLAGARVTSMEHEAGGRIAMHAAEDSVIAAFGRVFALGLREPEAATPDADATLHSPMEVAVGR